LGHQRGHTPNRQLEREEYDGNHGKDQYRIAEKYLNILSNPTGSALIQEQDQRMRIMEKQLEHLTQTIEALATKGLKIIEPALQEETHPEIQRKRQSNMR
jgi:hypothetical protein